MYLDHHLFAQLKLKRRVPKNDLHLQPPQNNTSKRHILIDGRTKFYIQLSIRKTLIYTLSSVSSSLPATNTIINPSNHVSCVPSSIHNLSKSVTPHKTALISLIISSISTLVDCISSIIHLFQYTNILQRKKKKVVNNK